MKIKNLWILFMMVWLPAIVFGQTFSTNTALGKAEFTFVEYSFLASTYDLEFEDLDGVTFYMDYFTFLGYLITIEYEKPELKVQWSNSYEDNDYQLLEVKEGKEFMKYSFLENEKRVMFSRSDSIAAMKEAVTAFAKGLDAAKFKTAISGSPSTSSVQHGFDYEYESPTLRNGDKVYLNYPGEMYSTLNLQDNSSAQSSLRSQGLSQSKINEIADYCVESNWPYGINSFDERTPIREKFRLYNCYQIGTFDDKVVLEVPYDKNQHMEAGMRPSRTIYFIVRNVGVRPASFYYKEGLPKISITDPGELYSTVDLAGSSEAMSAMRSAGMSQSLIDEVIKYSTETNWPDGLNTLDERLTQRDNIKRFNAYQMAVYGDKAILLIPREGNRHVPSNMVPTNDMYMVIGTGGLSGVNRYFTRPKVDMVGLGTTSKPTSYTTPSTGSVKWAKAKIHDSGKMYTTYRISEDNSAMSSMYSQGYSQKLIDDVLKYAHESEWPQGISSLSNWQNNKEVVNEYNAYHIASFGDKYILYIPMDQNKHMPSNMQVGHDFFMVMGTAGANISNYSSIDIPSKYQGPPAKSPSSSGSTSVEWNLDNLSEVKIVNVGRLYSTYDLGGDGSAISTLKNQGLSQSYIDDIIAYGNEKGWPEGINTLDERIGHWEDIAKYRVWVVGSFDDKVVLLIPKTKNYHMPPDYKPSRDFYFIIGDDGIE